MGENQRGVSGDSEEPRPHGLHDFYGREQELAWLRGLWEQAAGRSSDGSACPPSPRLAVVVADSGLGKTRLVQALYQQLTEDPQWDPAGVDYWPPAFQEPGKSLEVNPCMTGHACHGPPRFLWLGMRARDPSDRNADAGHTALSGAREALLAHVETARRHQGAWATLRERAAKGLSREGLGEAVGAAAEMVVPFAGLFAKLAKGTASALEGLGDRIEGVGERLKRHRQDLVEEMLEMLLEVLRRGGAGGRPLPVVLWVDDAQWIDPDALRLVAELWRSVSSGKGLPLLIVCTHWERDWRLLERALREAGGQLPIGRNSLPELIQRPGGEKWVLDKAGEADLAAYLAARLPGLTASQRELVLKKADGNFLTMVENVGELLAEPLHFEEDDLRGPLTEAGEEEVRGWELDRERRVAQIFKKLDKRLKESLGWSSRLGVRFLHDVVEEFAALRSERGLTARPEGGAPSGGAASGLDECVDPHAILDVPSAYLRVFRDRAWHVAAEKHFALRSKSTPSLVAELEAVLKRHLIEWVNNSFDEDGNAIWPDAERGIAAPPRSVTALPSEEARDLLVMAVVQLPLAESPDWSDPSHQAALRARVLSAFNDAADRLWDRVRIDATALGTVAWVELPEAVVAISARDSLRRLWWDAGAYEASDPLVEDLAARVRACPEHRERLVDYLMALGAIARERGDCERALQAWSEAGQVARDLVAQDNTPERQALLLDPLCYLGDLALVEYWHDIARAAFAEHLNIARRLADTSGTPKDLLRLAQAYEVIGDLEVACDKVVEADTAYAEFEAIARRVAAEVDTRDSRFGELKVFAGHALAMSLMKRSECQDDQEASRSLIREAIVMFRARAEDSQLPDDRWDLAKALIQLGWAEFDWDEDNARWRAAFEESIQIARDLVDTRGASNDLICLNQGLRQFSSWLTFPVSWKPRQEDYDRAHSVLAEAVEVSRGLVAHAETGRGSWREIHAETLLECIALNQESADAAACLPLSQELFEFNLRRFTAEITRIGGAMIRVNNLTLTDLNRLLWCHLEFGQVAEACEVVEKALSWATHLEAAFDDPAIDNAEQQLDATTLERCAEAWSLAARCAEEIEQDAARAAQCRDRASSLRDRIAAMKAGAGDGRGAGDDGGVS